MEKERLIFLLDKYGDGEQSSLEYDELSAFILDEKNRAAVSDAFSEAGMMKPDTSDYDPVRFEPILQRVLGADKMHGETVERRARVIEFNWRRFALAASIIGLLFVGYWFFVRGKGNVKSETEEVVTNQDVKAPETNRAMIVLADGRKIYLDSAANGSLAIEGGVKVEKLADGKIVYSSEASNVKGETVYNTLTNPRGSRVIDMMLSDGSHVWLNAGSAITYPVAFVGSERKVSITGEGYFEISHDAAKPFIVSKGETSIRVLGTHFNVNAYDDEVDIKVTLLEGSVRVNNTIITPGKQAQVRGNVKVVSNVNLEEVMAWKNGLFQFGEAGIEEVMRQVSRWYDVEVVYEIKPTEHFRGEISRDVEATKVLKMLEATEAVHFRIEGKKVYVTR